MILSNIRKVFLIAAVLSLSGCITFTDGAKLTDSSSKINYKNMAAAIKGSVITELPSVFPGVLADIKDESVVNAVLGEYKLDVVEMSKKINNESTNPKDWTENQNRVIIYEEKYVLNGTAANEANKKIILDYLNAEGKSYLNNYTLAFILDSYGNPAYYEYSAIKNKITLNYIYDSINIVYVFSPIVIFGNRKYNNTSLVFNIDGKNPYNSVISSCDEFIINGKFYNHHVQPPINEFLESLKTVPARD